MKRRIVIVEDSASDVELVKESLKMAGIEYELRVAVDGDEGMALLPRLGVDLPMPQLVILDLNLPGYSGFDILDEIRRRGVFASVPVVVMSGSLNPKDAETALAKGATLFLGKPHDLDTFLEHAHRLKALMDDAGARQ